jgi:hypothetical protein
MGGIGVRADHYRGEAAVWELDRLREPPASGLAGGWDLVDREDGRRYLIQPSYARPLVGQRARPRTKFRFW